MKHDLIEKIMIVLILIILIFIGYELKDINISTHATSITLEKIRMGMR